MAMDHLGQRARDHNMARSFGPVLLVRSEFRKLQQDLWLARGSYRLHDLDLAVHHRGSGRRAARCEIEHQTARQSTSGPSKPLGARGAKMADTIGPAQT